MYLLAVHEDSNSNAALFRDGRVLFAAAEERFTRVKHQAGFPYRAAAWMLESAGIGMDSVDVVVCANRFHPGPRILGRRFPSYEHSFLGIAQKLQLGYQHAVFKSAALRRTVEALDRALLRRRLGRDVVMAGHHESHAYSAYSTSGFEKAAAVTVDNYGDGLSAAVFLCDNGRCDMLYGSSALNSPGQFYGEVAQWMGFHPLLAGKMTGLAARGDPGPARAGIESLFRLSGDRRDFVLSPLLLTWKWNRTFRGLTRLRREDVAAAAQCRLEEVMLAYIREALTATGCENLVLAGGVFGNVRLNQRIAALPEVRGLFIHPAMNDQGISLGAGLSWFAREGQKPFRMKDAYWGPEFDERQMRAALEKRGLAWTKETDIDRTVAQLLARGKVVARFSGRMEYGLRALGNRSILFNTKDREVNDWLNKRLRRSEFMPFAPVTLAGYAGECYEASPLLTDNMRFMTVCAPCTERMKRLSPGVVHIDGTARPQLVNAEENPGYYRVLSEYHAITGVPSLINTSFNMHEEPIVCTPGDALAAFTASRLDHCALGPYLVSASGKPDSASTR